MSSTFHRGAVNMSVSLAKLSLLVAVWSAGFLLDAQCAELVEKEWWETALVYQIWPRGFQDSDGDGEGDLQGIISRLDYIQELGVDTIWLNPIYPSPMIDSGYDVSNYTDIHPSFGDLSQFEMLIRQAHMRELKVILDVIPNHSSDQHDWFLLSEDRVEPYNNYYIWADGDVDNQGNPLPPNNWVSSYSTEKGSAWTWSPRREQWYYHKFHESQPDLNLRNEFVVAELLSVFDFWLQRDVDGFRLDTVSYFFEDQRLQDEPSVGDGSYTSGLPENRNLLFMFRSYISDWIIVNNARPKMLIAEAYESDEKLISYYGNETHAGVAPFNFRLITHLSNDSDAQSIKDILDQWLGIVPNNASTNWVVRAEELSNHDNSRAASRIGLNRVDGLHMLALLLPGQAFTYYGEEIAMLDRKLSWSETRDPMACSRTNETFEGFSRDPARTPMQWDSSVSAGFSSNNNTYLPVHPDYVERNVEAQKARDKSPLNTYKQLAILRKDPVFTHGQYQLATLNNDHVLVMRRSLENHTSYIIITNLGLRQEKVNLTELYPKLEDPLEIVVASSNAVYIAGNISRDDIVLTANAALVIKAGEIEESTERPPDNSTTDHESTESPGWPSKPTSARPNPPTSTTTTTSISTTQDPNSSAQKLASVFPLTAIILIVITFLNH